MTLKLIYNPSVMLVARPQFTGATGSFIRPANPKFDPETRASEGELLAEFAGRACYQSWANPSGKTNAEYIANILAQGHGSVLEHANYSVYTEGVSRSLTHELVRHRAGLAYSQLSQRYVDESDVAFVVPPSLLDDKNALRSFTYSCERALAGYTDMLGLLNAKYASDSDTTSRKKRAREAARSVLPNATETRLVVTANIRAWRHVLALRGSAGADAEIRRWALAMFELLSAEAPAFFQDATVADGCLTFKHAKV